MYLLDCYGRCILDMSLTYQHYINTEFNKIECISELPKTGRVTKVNHIIWGCNQGHCDT